MKGNLKLKWAIFKKKVHDKFWRIRNRLADFIASRPEVVVAICGVFATVFRFLFKTHTTRKNVRDRDCTFYDRRCDHYVRSKRPLKNHEYEELDRRYRRGENYSSILRDMGLLK